MNPEPKPFSTPRLFGVLRVLPALFGGAFALTVASGANAKPEYAAALAKDVPMDCPPPCTLCHYSPTGGDETTRGEGFAISIQLAGGSNLTAKISEAITTMKTAPCLNGEDLGCQAAPMTTLCTGLCDADGDGVVDMKELEAGTNPNDATTFPCPGYGCGAHVAPTVPTRPIDGTAVLGALGAMIVLARRFRRA